VYYAAKTSQDPKMQELANDIQHAYFPAGVDGKNRELNLVFPMMIFKYSKYPNAAKEYLRFMMEKEQYVPWQEASIGYVCHPLAAYEKSAFWTQDPKKTPYRDCFKNGTPGGYAGQMGYASAACVADFIIPNMVAEAASGSKTPKEAAARAQARAERYYKV
jgi:multiple sugar transport system substrate-binding protein